MLSSSLESISSTCGNWAAAATVDPLEPPAWLVNVPLSVGGAERTLREHLGEFVVPEDDSKVGDYLKKTMVKIGIAQNQNKYEES